MGHWSNLTPVPAPFQGRFTEVAPVAGRINFISSSYGWRIKAKFVIFGRSLPPLDYITKALIEVCQSSKCFHSFSVLLGKVKEELSIDESRYNSKMMKLDLSSSGSKGIKDF